MESLQDVLSFFQIVLISKRCDVINFVESICSEELRLSVISSFDEFTFSDSTLLLIDASQFCTFDKTLLGYAESYSPFSICILPFDVSTQILIYAEKVFRFKITIPVKGECFRSYCERVTKLMPDSAKRCFGYNTGLDNLPDSYYGYFCGDSAMIKNVRKQIRTAAYSHEPVLLLGETGTGKTTAANVIHALSERHEKQMISISLSTVVESLAESTFFGHVKGSFTSAENDGKGCFEAADGTTLFMDELGVASLSLQTKLLTVLETGVFKRVGDDKEHHVDVRCIFATNADIHRMLREGTLRSDFYYRIYDNIIHLPPLRSRREDIRGMVLSYLEKESVLISEDAIERLEEYDWPGNIRELHKCLRRTLRNADNNVITADCIDFGSFNFPQ